MSNKLRIICILLFVSLMLWNCNSNDKPDNVLSEAEMTAIFLDIYETESILTSFDMGRDTVMVIFQKYEQSLFDHDGISKEDYYNSLTYYYDHPDILERIYEVIIDSLTLRESKIKALEESKRQKKDSIMNDEKLK